MPNIVRRRCGTTFCTMTSPATSRIFVASGAVPAQRLELRIAEKTFVARDPVVSNACGISCQLVVDEVGRGIGFAGWPRKGADLGPAADRAWVTALPSDAVR